jgi:mannose-1-phosphate guanylyltransferase
MSDIFYFILAGGSGERFWPLSRRRTPKHLVRLFGERALLADAVHRVLPLAKPDRVFVLTNQEQVEACREAVPELPSQQFIGEPAKRDTAPAAALATAIAYSQARDAICVLMPADTMIHDVETFRRQILDAAHTAANTSALVTIAIPPTHPATGYGYLRIGDLASTGPGGSRIESVEKFVEKPSREIAEQYCESGNYAWNGGMFAWSAASFIAECDRLVPPLAGFIRQYPSQPTAAGAYLEDEFPKLPKISVDYAIMEKAREVVAVRAEFDWDDVGSWTALPTHLGVGSEGNTAVGSFAMVRSKNNIVLSRSRTIALCGVSDLVVIETEDAVLVCHRSAAQQIKELQPLLPAHLQ